MSRLLSLGFACAVLATAFGCGESVDAPGGTAGMATAATGGSSGGSAGSGGAGGTTGGTGAGGGLATGGSGGAGGATMQSGGMPASNAGQPSGGRSGGSGGTGAGQGGSGATSGVTSGGIGGAPGGQGGMPAQAGSGGDSDVIVTITNGGYWLDTEGNRIEAHGAGLIRTEDAWYWIGEDKSHNSGTFKAVNCYRSTNLSDWEFRHAIITRDTSIELDAADRIIERPKVIYNDATKKYVMWLHWEGENYATAEAGVFTSDTVDGDYVQVRHFRPNDRMSRDDTLFKDDDGTAYFLSASNENADLSLYDLTDDYTNMKSQMLTLWPDSYREAPALMKASDRYFMITSGATGWDPNQAKYSTATSMGGPWSSLANLGDGTTYDTQSTFVLPVQGTKTTTYVYLGDRWQDPDLGSSKYIWLPLKLSGGDKLALDYYETWTLNVTTGEWSAGGDDGFISQSAWSLVSVDSEETAGENGYATNAFDDSRSTFWHTEWQDAQPAHPHEIVIELGASYSLTGMRYTPRQDKDQNGMVDAYEFYVSDTPSTWGTAVKTGSFGTTRDATTVTFPAKAGRYIRFVGLSEVDGRAYTSVAELDVAGTPL